jgi:hypothetical protein
MMVYMGTNALSGSDLKRAAGLWRRSAISVLVSERR